MVAKHTSDSTPFEPAPFDPDDPRLSAYALREFGGEELTSDETAAIEALLARDPKASEFVEGLRDTMRQLERAFAQGDGDVLSESQRAAILAQASASTSSTASAPTATSRPRNAWPRRMRIALAATIVVSTVGGTLLVVQPWRDGAGLFFDVAKVESPQPSSARHLAVGEGEVHMLKPLGYLDGAAPGGQNLRSARQKLREMGYIDTRLDFDPSPTSAEEYDSLTEHAFRRTLDEALSTFSIDVDTASYANVRRHLREGKLPSAGAVRVEELVNYFDYAYPQPTGSAPFSVTTDVLACPWDANRQLVRIGLKGREVHANERKDSHLVFLIDVSGSMNSADKLPLVQRSLRMLTEQLDVRDRVSIVVYAGNEGLVLEPTSGRERGAILEAIERLQSGGSTNGGAGIQLAYKVARQNFIEGGVNRVILCSDGDFNVGITSRDQLVKLVETERKSGVFLSVLGFGTGNLKDSQMEQLADKGNGAYAYIDSLAEARKVLVEQMSGTLETLAKDVKIQIEFNPAKVQAWRQIGYENRALQHQDFADDTKDAGEIGAGHTVTALYEIVPVGAPFEGAQVDGLRYQTPRDPLPTDATPSDVAPSAFGDEWMFVKLRYKAPDGDVSKLLEHSLSGAPQAWADASLDARFAASVAAFGMKLRGSEHVRALTFAQIRRMATDALGRDERGWRVEFLDLVRRADELSR
jgi:Ca-activated chloride channel family protein